MGNYNKARVTLTNTAGKGAFRAANGFTLFISNEDMNDIIKIIKSIDDSGVLIDEVTETVNDGIKKQEGGFLGLISWSFVTTSSHSIITNSNFFCNRRCKWNYKRSYKIRKRIYK